MSIRDIAIEAAALAMYGTPRLAERNHDMAERAINAAAAIIRTDERAKVAEQIAVAMHACLTCGQPHEFRMLADETYTWAHPGDGHDYRTALAAEDCDIAAAIARGHAAAPAVVAAAGRTPTPESPGKHDATQTPTGRNPGGPVLPARPYPYDPAIDGPIQRLADTRDDQQEQ